MAVCHLLEVDLYYETAGAGPRLVLLHGLGSSSADWGLQLPEFSARYTVITVDLRGHGRSQPRPGARALSVAQMADDVAALLRELGGPAAHVVGLSLGGCTAQLLAGRYPEVVRSLVLCNTFIRLRPDGVRGAARLARRAWLFATAPMPVVAEYVAAGLFPKPEHHALKVEAASRLGRNQKRPYLAAMRAVVGFNSGALVGAIRCPTLVLAGDSDQTVPLAAGRALARAIPGARFDIIADSGHATPYDQPQVFNQTVLDFLAKVGSGHP